MDITHTRSKKERYFFYNNLVGVVKGLEGHYTTIDLRNESCITGRIKHVDGLMNVELEDAVFYDQRGVEHVFESYFITARLIRYVHIPKDQDAVQIANDMVDGITAHKKIVTKPTFKLKRAQKYHNETVASIMAATAAQQKDESVTSDVKCEQ